MPHTASDKANATRTTDRMFTERTTSVLAFHNGERSQSRYSPESPARLNTRTTSETSL